MSRLGLPSEYDYWLREYSLNIPLKSITTNHHPHHLVIDVVAIPILGLIVRMLELDRDCGLGVPVTPYVRPKTARRFPIYGSFYLDKTGQRPFDANIFEDQKILTQDVKG